MRYVHRGVLLGIVLSSFIFCQQIPREDGWSVCCATEQEQVCLPDNVFITCKPSLYPTGTATSRAATAFDVLSAYMHDPNFCKWYYDMTLDEINRLMKVGYDRIVSEIIKLDHLSSKQMAELFNVYKRGCYKRKEVERCQVELLAQLQQRAENYKQQLLRQRQLEKEQIAEQRMLERVYHVEMLQVSDQQSPYGKDRQEALQKTKDQQYKKYERSRELDEQTVGLCIAKTLTTHSCAVVVGLRCSISSMMKLLIAIKR